METWELEDAEADFDPLVQAEGQKGISSLSFQRARMMQAPVGW